jgi:S-DNA-T family DNA segregation ATPase FtsK/SpoIIIE
MLVGVNMIIYILHSDRYFSFRLPKKREGSFVLHDFDGNSYKRNLVNISAVDSKWIMKSNDKVKIFSNNQTIDSIELVEYSFYFLITNSNERIYLYVSPGNDQSFIIKKIVNKNKLVFGSNSSCDVIFASNLISSKQFELKKEDKMWTIKSLDPKALLYVNERRCNEKLLCSFDYIFINGFKIIVCGDVFFINNPSSVVQFGADFVDLNGEYLVQNVSESSSSFSDFYEESDYFSKSPVFRKKTNHIKVIITSPEDKEKKNDLSSLMSIVPSALMSVTTLLSAYFSVKSYNSGSSDKETLISTVVMCVIMLFISLVWPFIERLAESVKILLNNINRNFKYLSYIKKKRSFLEKARNDQKLALQFNNLSLDECQDVITKKTAYLFSVNSEQKNFLDVKLGVGKVKMDLEFDYSKPDFIKTKDKLLDVIDKMIEEYKYIDSAPYSFSLSNNVAFIYGEKDYEAYLSSIVLQIITYHDYYNLKLVVFTSEGSFLCKIRDLNHCWNNDCTMRFFATDVQDAETLSSYLIRIFNSRSNPPADTNDLNNSKTPFYLILCDDIDKYRNLSIIDKVLHQKDKNLGFSFVTFAKKIVDVPDCCSYFVDFKDEVSTLFQSEMDESNIMKFTPELVNPRIDIQKCLTTISNTPIKNNVESNGLLPDKIGFLELNNVGRIEQLNSINKWKTSQIVNTLAAPIGVDVNGNILSLDLHEKKHGPHGLIAGMTGSGKSEFIITYILSLAVNYSPEEVQFVLIDYKGGGLAGAFENRKTGVKLPHLVGTITNLDKSSMNRTLVSIKSELQRRQRVFNDAKERLNTGTIDIYKYQKLVRDGSLSESMSHLFIICDEFAELKAQQPDFMDELVSAARIGRSLGIHLILATQKPSGVVDDQIWSNAKFKVCCKVQTADDSKEMIRRDDAAFIKESGRFFLQVGYDEIFVKGQSAYTGTPYKPSDTVVNSDAVKKDVEFLDNLGNVILSVKNDVNTVKDDTDYGDELGNVLNYLVQCAKEIGFVNKQLWLDNVPEKIYLYDLYKKYPVINKKGIICPLIGEYDDPQNQMQGPVKLNITERGNLWISGVYGCGKTTLLSTIIYSSAVNYNTQELNIYIVDLLAETLKMFSNLPQVGDFVSSTEPTKLNKLFYYLTQEVQKRKRYYSNLGSTFLSEISKGNIHFPNIFVVVNGIDIMVEQYDTLYNDIFMPLVRDCNRVGIYFIITSTGSLNVAVENSFPQKIAMRYLDATEYSMLYNNARGIIPSINPGRGLVELDNVYEFQTALIFDDVNFDYNLNYVVNQLNKSLTKANSIPVMPRIVTYENVKDEIVSLESLPIGIDTSSNCVLSFDFSKIINYVVYSNEKMAASFISGFIRVLHDLKNIKIIVLDNIGVTTDIEGVQIFNSNFKKISQALFKNINEKKSTDLDAEKIIFIISGYTKINNHLKQLKSDDAEVKTIDDLINSSLNSENFKFIIVNDKSLSTIDDKEWSDYLDPGYGILLGTDKDDQNIIEADDSYDNVKINKDSAIVVDDFKKKYIKFIRNRS